MSSRCDRLGQLFSGHTKTMAPIAAPCVDLLTFVLEIVRGWHPARPRPRRIGSVRGRSACLVAKFHPRSVIPTGKKTDLDSANGSAAMALTSFSKVLARTALRRFEVPFHLAQRNGFVGRAVRGPVCDIIGKRCIRPSLAAAANALAESLRAEIASGHRPPGCASFLPQALSLLSGSPSPYPGPYTRRS